MLNVLILGHSSIARRRVIPALRRAGFSEVEVATRGDYENAIDASSAPLVYVSTVNASHARLARRALERGKHVIVDKPAALSLSDVEELVRIARDRLLVIAEANVWGWHPQIAAARALFESPRPPALRIAASFTMPLWAPGNFRHRASLGGGIVWDLGPYAVSAARLFFAAPSDGFVARAIQPPESEVHHSFALLATYAHDRMLVGHFAANAPYVNRLEIQSKQVTVTVTPAFTTPADVPCTLHVVEDDRSEVIEIDSADSFTRFISDVLDAISQNDIRRHSELMLADATELERLAVAAGIQLSSLPMNSGIET
jgi:NDP-hexose-3-ketoreductase